DYYCYSTDSSVNYWVF
nr:immunoglobulin light chain junction region [Macaca mulatta]MOX32445.1 immunoglobulin light chain junction region [Macaca mulatta]MOX32741.1 immunoglobulin light chain junction region [Macaca mulatta]